MHIEVSNALPANGLLQSIKGHTRPSLIALCSY